MYDTFIPLIRFAFATSITPGPNNMMLMASGANFGIRRTLPHLLGVSLGHAFMTFLVGIGLSQIFDAYPVIRQILLMISCVYLVYLAWRTATAAAPREREATGKPLTFLQAAAFQWVNPKAIYMSIAAQTSFAPEGSGWNGALCVAFTFMFINLLSVSTWAIAGTYIRHWLSTPYRLTTFNYVMAGLILLTLVPILRSIL